VPPTARSALGGSDGFDAPSDASKFHTLQHEQAAVLVLLARDALQIVAQAPQVATDFQITVRLAQQYLSNTFLSRVQAAATSASSMAITRVSIFSPST